MKTIIQKDIKDFLTIKIKLKSMGEYKRLIRKLKSVGKFATRHEIPLEIEIAKNGGTMKNEIKEIIAERIKYHSNFEKAKKELKEILEV